jgi:hypothetical protein
MRKTVAIALVLSLASTASAQAATYFEQQICMTWLSLAGHFGPEAERDDYAKRYRELADRAGARADVPQESRSSDEQIAMQRYTEWTDDYAKRGATDGAEMVASMMGSAAGCIGTVTDEKLDPDPQTPELNELLQGDHDQGLPAATPM